MAFSLKTFATCFGTTRSAAERDLILRSCGNSRAAWAARRARSVKDGRYGKSEYASLTSPRSVFNISLQKVAISSLCQSAKKYWVRARNSL